ncbi:hypothetical protein KR054_009321, partial [Drosophila jambulina]
MAFQIGSKLQRTPPGGGPPTPALELKIARNPAGCETDPGTATPKRTRDSPSPTGSAHPIKRVKATAPLIEEMGDILADLPTKVNEQKTRSSFQAM